MPGPVAWALGRLGYTKAPKPDAAASREASQFAQELYKLMFVQAQATIAHPGITLNDLGYGWRHPTFFASCNYIATAAMGVPFKVLRLVPSTASRKTGKFIGAATCKHVRAQYRAYHSVERAHTLPWPEFLERKGLELEEAEDEHPLRDLLDRVNSQDTWLETIYQTMFHLEAAGNAYWWLAGGGKGKAPQEIHILRPDRTHAVPSELNFIAGWKYEVDGKSRTFPADEVLHFRYPHPMNDVYGLARAEVLENVLKTDWYRLEYALGFFQNGCILNGILKPGPNSADILDKDTAARILADFKKKYVGVENIGKVALMAGGVDYEAIASSPRDADWLRMAGRHDAEIAKVTGVPTVLLHPESATFANLEGAEHAFWTQKEAPSLRMVAAQANEFLAPAYGEDILIDVDLSDVEALSEEATARVTRAGQQFEGGAISIDEYRESDGREALPNGEGERYKRKFSDVFVRLGEDHKPPEPETPQPTETPAAQPNETPANNGPQGAQETPQAPVMPDAGQPPATTTETPAKSLWRLWHGKQRDKATKALPAYGDATHRKAMAAWERRLQPMEEQLRKDVETWARALEAEVMHRLDRGKSLSKATIPDPLELLFSADDAGELLWEIVRVHALESMETGGARITEQLGAGGMGWTFDPENPRVIDYLKSKELKVKRVPEAFHEDLRKTLVESIRDGAPVEDIRRDLQEKFDWLGDSEARTIAQTETVGALNNGAFDAMSSLGGTKMWFATLDDKVRDEHMDCMAEGAIPMDEPFATNGLMYPGDPDGEAASTINCRCTIAYTGQEGELAPEDLVEGAQPEEGGE